MARAIWSGALTFGLVNVPVKLVTAVTQKEVRFHMLHDADGGRIQLKRFCAKEDVEVPYEHIVKGYELSKGKYVAITPEELEKLDPKATRTVDIHDFVELAEIDPVYFDKTYYLVPDGGAAKAYALLRETMRRSGKVAIATFVLRTRESLCCVRPIDDALALSTMNRADEVLPVSALELPARAKPSERELAMAEQLVGSLAAAFEPERYPDLHRERVLELVRRKAEGETIEAPEPERAPAGVVSLADALSASLAAARRRGEAPERERAAATPARGERRHRPAAAARTAGKKRKATRKARS
ncbi:Ku protein [Anaeromyxobacter sp. Fw109-5]|uniref:non-homologous end joining protein Ku n=1 Tax=Anaeromyxobacter sp. (strain Fw109-5) TaxID=404589 RepID=UPI000158A7BE|nr:Ku protein [Anaeromyxobacter sp. Fw109-5]ABS25217.1 Ku family containing protein [Anaeromyxobacter sp. Fw109-5]